MQSTHPTTVTPQDSLLEAKMRLRRMQENLRKCGAGDEAKAARLRSSIAALKEEIGAPKKLYASQYAKMLPKLPRDFARSVTKPHQHHLLTEHRKETA